MNGDTIVVFTLQQFSKFNGPCQMGILCYPSKLVKVQGSCPGHMGILGQDVNVCHLNKRFVENFFMNKNVFFRSLDQENWGLTKKVKMVLGKGCHFSKSLD